MTHRPPAAASSHHPVGDAPTASHAISFATHEMVVFHDALSLKETHQ